MALKSFGKQDKFYFVKCLLGCYSCPLFMVMSAYVAYYTMKGENDTMPYLTSSGIFQDIKVICSIQYSSGIFQDIKVIYSIQYSSGIFQDIKVICSIQYSSGIFQDIKVIMQYSVEKVNEILKISLCYQCYYETMTEYIQVRQEMRI